MKFQKFFYYFSVITSVLIGLILSTSLCFAQAVQSNQNNIRVLVDGKEISFDQPPVIKNNRVLVPLRGVLEAVGTEVVWNSKSRTVVAKRGYRMFSVGIGKTRALTNIREVDMDVPPLIINNRTMIPVRFAAESIGTDVEWDGSTRTVKISTALSKDADSTVTENGKIEIKSGEGSFSGYIDAGSTCSIEIEEDIDPDKLVILSLSDLDENNKKKFNYLLLENIKTGQSVRYNEGAAVEGGHAERSRIRYFRTSDSENLRYRAVVSTPGDGYSGKFTVNVKIVNRLSYVKKDTAGNIVKDSVKPSASSTEPFEEDTPRTYCISSSPEAISSIPLDVYRYKEASRPAELGENGYYLQRSPVNRNANIYWEHINNYYKDMKFGVLLWNTEKKALTVKLNSRSFYGSESNSADFNCSTRVWIERANGEKSLDRDEVDEFYQGFGPDMTIEIPAYNEENPAASARWICLYTVKGIFGFCYFNGVADISITDSSGAEYTGQKLYCDTYVMEPGTKYDLPTHEITRQNVLTAKRAFGDKTYRGSGNGAVLEAHIEGTTDITENKPFSFTIGGFEVPVLSGNELVTINDCIWDNERGCPTDTINYIEAYPKKGTTSISTDDVREINGRVNGVNYGVIYKVTFDRIKSDKPVKGKVKFNSKVIGCFYDFGLNSGYPSMLVSVYDDKGNSYEAVLNRSKDLASPYIEAVFNPDVSQEGPVTYNFVLGGMGFMPAEISFEN